MYIRTACGRPAVDLGECADLLTPVAWACYDLHNQCCDGLHSLFTLAASPVVDVLALSVIKWWSRNESRI